MLSGNDGKPLKIFGVSSDNLDQDFLLSLIERTGTRGIAAHAFEGSDSILIARLMELAGMSSADENGASRNQDSGDADE